MVERQKQQQQQQEMDEWLLAFVPQRRSSSRFDLCNFCLPKPPKFTPVYNNGDIIEIETTLHDVVVFDDVDLNVNPHHDDYTCSRTSETFYDDEPPPAIDEMEFEGAKPELYDWGGEEEEEERNVTLIPQDGKGGCSSVSTAPQAFFLSIVQLLLSVVFLAKWQGCFGKKEFLPSSGSNSRNEASTAAKKSL